MPDDLERRDLQPRRLDPYADAPSDPVERDAYFLVRNARLQGDKRLTLELAMPVAEENAKRRAAAREQLLHWREMIP